MSVTLNLTHTFETRVHYSSELIKEVREELAEQISNADEYIARLKDPRKKSKARAGVGIRKMALDMDDDGLVLFLTRESFKNSVKEEIASGLKELSVTRMSPVRTVLVSSKGPKEEPKACSRCEVVKKTTSHTQCETCRSCSEVV